MPVWYDVFFDWAGPQLRSESPWWSQQTRACSRLHSMCRFWMHSIDLFLTHLCPAILTTSVLHTTRGYVSCCSLHICVCMFICMQPDKGKKETLQNKSSLKGWTFFYTWDVFRPANDDHQLAVSKVAQRGQSLNVALWHGRVGHGIDLLWLRNQQVRHYLCDWGWGGRRGMSKQNRGHRLYRCKTQQRTKVSLLW